MIQAENEEEEDESETNKEHIYAPKDFECGPRMDPSNVEYSRGKRRQGMAIESARMASSNQEYMLNEIETTYIVLADDEPEDYNMAMKSSNSNEWKMACQKEIDTLRSYDTWELVMPPSNINIIGSRWIFRIKRDNLGNICL